jgi:hypothetical protein
MAVERIETGKELLSKAGIAEKRADMAIGSISSVERKGTLKSAGRVTIEFRSPSALGAGGITVGPLRQ